MADDNGALPNERRLIVEMDCPCGARLSIDYRPSISIAAALVGLCESWNKSHTGCASRPATSLGLCAPIVG